MVMDLGSELERALTVTEAQQVKGVGWAFEQGFLLDIRTPCKFSIEKTG